MVPGRTLGVPVLFMIAAMSSLRRCGSQEQLTRPRQLSSVASRHHGTKHIGQKMPEVGNSRYQGNVFKSGNYTYSGTPNAADNMSVAAMPSEVLVRKAGAWVLVGDVVASMRAVNGGRHCVGPWGREPSKYELHGSIGLAHCSALASAQKGSVGFRWGREGFDSAAYHMYVAPDDAATAVQLSTLFAGALDYTCAIYMSIDPATGYPYELSVGNLTGYIPDYRNGVGDQVCYQRWDLNMYFQPWVDEMWFCYMSENDSATELCVESTRTKNVEGALILFSGMVFLVLLAYIMRESPEFEKPLSWLAQFVLFLELGLFAVATLLRTGQDSGLFPCAAVIIILVAQYFILLPYRLAQQFLRSSPFNTAYLLILAFSPCVSAEIMSYTAAFPLLITKWPCALGVFTYALEKFFKYCSPGGSARLPDGVNKYMQLTPAKEAMVDEFTTKAPFSARDFTGTMP